MRANRRGAVLGVVIVMALVIATAIYGILVMATSQARQAAFSAARLRAQYAREVGLVWAYQRLRENPAYCGTPDPPSVGGSVIDVQVPNCGASNPEVNVVVSF